MGRRGLWIWGGVASAAVLIALAFTSALGDSLVDVGLDVDSKCKLVPQVLEQRGTELVPVVTVERVPARFVGKGILRYHARVPRNALDRLVFKLGGEDVALFDRVFVATWTPRIFYGPQGPPAYRSWRGEHEQWEPIPSGRTRFKLPPLNGLDGGGLKTVLALGSLAFLLLGSLALGICIARRFILFALACPTQPGVLAPFSPRVVLTFFLSALPVWLFYLASYFPGIGSLDVNDQWKQAHGIEPLTNAHPAFHTLSIRFLSAIWESPASIALVQILCLAAVLSYAFSLLWRARVPRTYIVIAFALTILSPRIGLMSILLWKDIPYAVVCVLLAVLIAHYLLEPKVREKRLFWGSLILALTLIPSFRHNGFLVVLGVSCLLPIVFWQQRRAALVCIVATIALLGGIRLAIQHGFSVEYGDNYFSRNNAIRLSALLVHQEVPLAPSELVYLDETLGFERLSEAYEWWDSDRPAGGQTLRWRLFTGEKIKATEGEFLEFSASLTVRYASYVLHYAAVANELPYIVTSSEANDARRTFRKISRFPIVGFPHSPLVESGMPFLEELYHTTVERRFVWAFWRTGWHLYLSLIALVIVVVRRRDPRWILVFLGVYLNTLSLTLALASPHVRYQFPLVLATGFLVGLALLPKPAPTSDLAPTTSD